MQITHAVRGLLVAAGAWLAACNGPAAESPVAQDAPATASAPTPAPATATEADTVQMSRPASNPVPFVTPSKAGRLLGPQTPSPPASRTR
ncbi:hypothetical protein [Hymenobacter arizonensis]|uniref:Uncharacterized protein n=1 Tax=Hymenobacter arizonensis TaxID=1227077 RepID=A0A1I5X076_HYMAR|nr:hypothetical protein [Hymenobacter arizonensis]SFQ25415.1 hypothetical protein SAMN04515668_1583 [Hymenobacter arizonensis]